MERYNSKELLEIQKIVQFGTKVPEDFKISFYKEVYDKDVAVRIRGLSTFEYEEISVEMYSKVKDPKTIKYLFDTDKKEVKEENNLEENNLEEKEEDKSKKSIMDREIPVDLNPSELTNAYRLRNVLIVYYAMRDFYNDITIDYVKQLEGLDEIAKRVNEKSGRNPEIIKKIEFFREKQREHNNKVSTEERTQTK